MTFFLEFIPITPGALILRFFQFVARGGSTLGIYCILIIYIPTNIKITFHKIVPNNFQLLLHSNYFHFWFI